MDTFSCDVFILHCALFSAVVFHLHPYYKNSLQWRREDVASFRLQMPKQDDDEDT